MAGEIPSNQPEVVARPAETGNSPLRHYMRKYESLAENIFFGGISKDQVLEIAVFRDDKTFRDVGTAFGTGLLNGQGRFEVEMEQCAIELEKVIGLRADTYDRFEQILREHSLANSKRNQ